MTHRSRRLADRLPSWMGSIRLRLAVVYSVLLFGLAVMPMGLVLATVILIMVSSAASHEFRWKEALVASLVLAAFVTVAFGYGLKLQLPILPPLLTR